MKALTEKRFFEWYEDDKSVSLRACSGSYGGGGERGARYLLYQDKVGTLCATDYKWVQQEQVMQGKLIVMVINSSGNDIAGTLDSSYYKGQGERQGVEREFVYCVGNGQAESLSLSENVRTLSCMHDQQIVLEGETMKTVVRRLTPTECERLQGFPDGWTDIGEWTDSNGKLHKESSDTARYKALGNSIATPFWFWLMKRISAQYSRTPTLGSLFDGIGGFPYCWARINGLSSCVWASEIEEFPIAVTKKHFGEDGDFYEILARDERNKSNNS